MTKRFPHPVLMLLLQGATNGAQKKVERDGYVVPMAIAFKTNRDTALTKTTKAEDVYEQVFESPIIAPYREGDPIEVMYARESFAFLNIGMRAAMEGADTVLVIGGGACVSSGAYAAKVMTGEMREEEIPQDDSHQVTMVTVMDLLDGGDSRAMTSQRYRLDATKEPGDPVAASIYKMQGGGRAVPVGSPELHDLNSVAVGPFGVDPVDVIVMGYKCWQGLMAKAAQVQADAAAGRGFPTPAERGVAETPDDIEKMLKDAAGASTESPEPPAA